MNEFTKEELIEINRCLRYMTKGGVTPYSCLTMALKNRTQQMIDFSHRKPINVWHCEKCGHVQ